MKIAVEEIDGKLHLICQEETKEENKFFKHIAAEIDRKARISITVNIEDPIVSPKLKKSH